jgi:cell fate (sporulation/competence/biofilm development) regulator YmcA (YheA/YmcA/DUF963 family)
MRYVFLLLILTGCYTSKKAEKDINKAQLSYPEIVAKKCSEIYPCKIEPVRIDSFEITRWLLRVDSINTIEQIVDTITYVTDCNPLKQKLKDANKLIDYLKKTLNEPVPVEYRFIEITDTAKLFHLNSMIEKYRSDKDKYQQKYQDFLKLSIWLIVILCISLLYNFKK